MHASVRYGGLRYAVPHTLGHGRQETKLEIQKRPLYTWLAASEAGWNQNGQLSPVVFYDFEEDSSTSGPLPEASACLAFSYGTEPGPA